MDNEQLTSSHQITDRMLAENRRMQSSVTFDGLRSNSGILPENPDVSINSTEVAPHILALGRAADIEVSRGLKTELEQKQLLPDGKTFYLIDFGLPHLPALSTVLLEAGIDPAIYTQPSPEHVNASPDHFARYHSVYEEHRDKIYQLRQKLEKPKGHALMVNSHAEPDEAQKIGEILPNAERLKQMGISRIVLGKEVFYHYGNPKPDDPSWQTFFQASEVNKWAKQLSEQGIDVVVIGFDYRMEQQEASKPEVSQVRFDTYDPAYKPGAVEVYDTSICQSFDGKRLVFNRQSGKIEKIINGFARPVSAEDAVLFARNILDAIDDEQEKNRLLANLTSERDELA